MEDINETTFELSRQSSNHIYVASINYVICRISYRGDIKRVINSIVKFPISNNAESLDQNIVCVHNVCNIWYKLLNVFFFIKESKINQSWTLISSKS